MSQGLSSSDGRGAARPRPHFVLVPLMAQGHLIPMLDLALLLARRGALVSFFTTPLNTLRIKGTIDRAGESGASVRLVELPFPCAEAGLLDGHESADDMDSTDSMLCFFKACGLLRKPLEQHLRRQRDYPSCIISDFCHHWTREVAVGLGVPRLTFSSMCCFTLLADLNIRSYKVYDAVSDDKEPFTVPGLLHSIEVNKVQAPGFFSAPGPDWKKLDEQVREAEFAADGIVMNTFDDLEPWYIENYAKAMDKKVWSVGPLSLCHESVADMAIRGKNPSVDSGVCLAWLDSMQPSSVLYVSFGILVHVGASQLVEIGKGLEATEHPYVWALKDDAETGSEKMERWLSERFKGGTISTRALVVKGWAPHVMILSHPAVGGFMTQCGWNSTLEGVAAGVPMITWPHFSDQFLNERMVVDVLGTGVPVGVEEPSAPWATEEPTVGAGDIERAVRCLMDVDGSKEGGERRKRAKALGEKAKDAMRDGGSSHRNMADLIMHFSGP